MTKRKDFTLIGAGIMSATLGVLLKELMPDAKISIYERLDQVGAESSDAWNNAGTGHSAFCELNYTPERKSGVVDISKALKISQAFEESKQLWAYLKENGKVRTGSPFINDIDHMSFVWGKKNIQFLQKRHTALSIYGMFEDMEYSEDFGEISEWLPLMMDGRNRGEEIAVTRMAIGTDVNFGAITRGMIEYLQTCDGVEVHLGHHVEDLKQEKDGRWCIEVEELATKEEKEIYSDFVFIGAGVSRHEAKVYGKAAKGSPPMSVPHLDTRMLDGERSLLFGPYAGFSTKFLKNGSYLDLPLSIEVHNVWPMLAAGIQNIGLTKYLIKQVFQSPEERFAFLQKFYPEAKMEDWELITAGQRVQIIKKDKEDGGVLKFGTEIVSSEDKSLVALLGASPGASTAVTIMLDLLKTCFPDDVKSDNWQTTLTNLIPSYGQSLIADPILCKRTRDYTTKVLKLEE